MYKLNSNLVTVRSITPMKIGGLNAQVGELRAMEPVPRECGDEETHEGTEETGG